MELSERLEGLNMRTPFLWILVISTLGICPEVYGLSTTVQLNRTNIIQDLSFLQIHSTNESLGTIRFRVIVVPEHGILPTQFVGGLEVYDSSSNLVVSCWPISTEKLPVKSKEVAAEYSGKCVVFDFRVAPAVLRFSRFFVSNVDSNGPAVDSYWFYLKDFVDGNKSKEGGLARRSGEIQTVHDVAHARIPFAIAAKQLTGPGALVVFKCRQPVQNAREILPDVQKLTTRPILATTEFNDWIWFATDVVRDGETGTIRTFIGGYAVHKRGTDMIKWSVW